MSNINYLLLKTCIIFIFLSTIVIFKFPSNASQYLNDGDLDLIVCGKYGIDADNNPTNIHLFGNNGVKKHNCLKIKINEEIMKVIH